MNKVIGTLRWLLVYVAVSACVEPIYFKTPPALDVILIDGMINDGPGPYIVKVSRGRTLSMDSTYRFPVQGAVVTLFDDAGVKDQFIEERLGEYRSRGIIRGSIGHSYYITVQMPDGNRFQSEPETILPPGEIKELRFTYESRQETKPFGLVEFNLFNIFIDSKASTGNTASSYIRWRLNGTYRIDTSPHLHVTFLQASAYMTPYPCSGYVVEPAMGGGKLVQKGPCTCCTCWLKIYETKPQLSDTELVTGGEFRNIKVGEVPINRETFHDKFLAEVEQMPISKTAFDYFKLVRIQKEAATNLFQPPSGRLVGNIRAENDEYPVVGLFWATSVTTKSIYLTKDDVPYPILPMDVIPEPCLSYANSTTTKPTDWRE